MSPKTTPSAASDSAGAGPKKRRLAGGRAPATNSASGSGRAGGVDTALRCCQPRANGADLANRRMSGRTSHGDGEAAVGGPAEHQEGSQRRPEEADDHTPACEDTTRAGKGRRKGSATGA